MKKTVFALVLALASLAVGYLTTPAMADGHDQLCKDNYNRCMKGCDGATSCSNQCQTNYNNCMKR